ncbi:MAG: aldo/keto reductase [Candidatus Hydrogenedentes bacterium]|nr:aldo/keto reductase [Candidatus Hydrogenedentota bacterium]
MTSDKMHRRDFMKNATLLGAGMTIVDAARLAAQEEESAPPPPAPAAGSTTEIPPLAGTVPRRKLGSTGEEIPMLYMGGSQKFDTKYDKLLHRAFKLGINYIDTAEMYAQGQSHAGVAVFQQQVGRKNLWITTKAALTGTKMTPENYKTHLDKCLEELQTDYADMFFMHMIQSEDNLEPDFLKMGEEIKKSGKAKYFGFSCHHGNVAQLLQKAAKVGGIDAIQFRFNFRQYGDTELNNAIDACKKAGVGLLAMKTQSSIPNDIEKVVEFQSKNFNLFQAKLKSVWADDRIDAAVSGMTNVQVLTENAAAAMSPVQLTMNEFHQLNRLARLTAPYACLGCNHICESRIAGKLKVADALRYLMYHECYGDPETARLLYAALTPEERDFDGLDLSEAINTCPQGIRIDKRLRRAKELLLA